MWWQRQQQTIWNRLGETSKTVLFRVAGPWLGAVFPSDYSERVVFDAPTGA